MGDGYYVGVDVGTSSVRAALVSSTGKIVTTATEAITIWEPEADFYEQSSDQIWSACCSCIKAPHSVCVCVLCGQSVVADVDKASVRGLGFDATCSLVVLDSSAQPLSVSPSGEDRWNVVMWMDHRAGSQTSFINSKPHSVLHNVGGAISLEMQPPKLLWLKQNLKNECWGRAGYFFDLPDFLTWKATGSESRSMCSLVCKLTYRADAHERNSWDADFFTQIGLDDLVADNFKKLGVTVLKPGEPSGGGLTQQAAADMGLSEGTPVATSMIDAHAGALGTLGCQPVNESGDCEWPDINHRLSLICGTSTCHMTVSVEEVSVPGVWGPYFSAIVPGMWCNEGGQSAAGKLIDHIVMNHASFSWLKQDADSRSVHPHIILNEVLGFIARRDNVASVSQLTSQLHIWPDFHGNRSPLADLSLRGMVCGLTLAHGMEDLALLYLAAIQALAYGSRHIIESMEKAGHSIKLIICCGGLSKNPLYVSCHADATGLPVVLPAATESVLLGSAMLGARASGDYPSLQEAMSALAGTGQMIRPSEKDKSFHDRKYRVFLKMVEHQKLYQDIMDEK